MNQFELKKAAARLVGRALLAEISDGIKGARVNSQDLPRLQAIESILRAHAEDKRFHQADIQAISQALAEPLLSLNAFILSGRFGNRSHGNFQTLTPEHGKIRKAAERLLQYLEIAHQLHMLGGPKVAAICARVPCSKLFIKAKTDQKYCSGECQFHEWSEIKRQNDPRYFSNKTMENRKSKKDLAEGRRKRGVVKSEVELLPKDTKKHGKARKA